MAQAGKGTSLTTDAKPNTHKKKKKRHLLYSTTVHGAKDEKKKGEKKNSTGQTDKQTKLKAKQRGELYRLKAQVTCSKTMYGEGWKSWSPRGMKQLSQHCYVLWTRKRRVK